MDFYALDLETESLDPAHPEYALQPWRVGEGKGRISLVCIGPWTYPPYDYDFITEGCYSYILNSTFKDGYIWTWNGIFDVAFLIASGVDCSKVKWLDAMSAFKWAIRSQITDPPMDGKRFSWSLENAAKCLLKDWTHYEEYAGIKQNIQTDKEYWLRRCKLDVEATLLIGEKLFAKLTQRQRKAFLIEQEMIYPAALAWVNGCYYAMEQAIKLESSMMNEREKLLTQLNVDEKVLASPKQLAELVYDVWCVPFDENSRTPKGERGVSKPALKLLIENYSNKYPQLKKLGQYRELKTKTDKFVLGPKKIQAYLGKGIFHHSWRINSTYTGRCTVSSKTRGSTKTKQHPIGLPLHQIPKQGDYRKFIVAPPGCVFIVADVDSQETKLMTDASSDPAFLKIYAEGLNPHAFTASKIAGIPYKEIVEGKETDDRLATIYKAGKITNLSSNYRIGAAKLWENAHTQWDLTPTKDEVKKWLHVWRSTYKGVIQQWDKFIQKARHYGYAETLAGRRFYINQWGKYKWKSESSAIMCPIQGSGADMKYLAIATVRKRFPKLTFWGEIHDEIVYVVPEEFLEPLFLKNIKATLDNLPYAQAWCWAPKVPFTWTVSYGKNWKELTSI